jgi:hypothetical protein
MGESARERRNGRRIQVFVRNAINAMIADSTEMLPASLNDDAFEGDAIPGSAPCE